ncbi:DHH family phosphoesterase [Paenibacillus gansuensis]|uniref:DHH family phosphoesterase n=1 Tax=Paenibacillus gansuensis TaxID=306542 RepID=A0ABW5P9F9_9BACL
MKYYLLSHNDLDGVGCGIVAKLAFGDQADIRYNSLSGLNVSVERYLDRWKGKIRADQMLFITDLSVHESNEQALSEFAEKGGQVRLIDHHKSALHLNDRPWAEVTVAYEDGRLASATSLFCEHLIKQGLLERFEALDHFVELVRQYDTWEWDANGNEEAKRLNDLFYMVSIDEFEASMLGRLRKGESFSFDAFEERILDMEEEKIGRYVRRKGKELVQTFIGGLCTGIVHAEAYHSELGNLLGKQNPHLDYIAILNMGGKRVSLRTIHDHIDVSEIAGQYGGGGHAKASGCMMTEEVYRSYVSEIFPLEPIRLDAFRNYYNLKDSAAGALYEDREGSSYYLHRTRDGWGIEQNGQIKEQTFSSFQEAESHIKRQFGAALSRDERYVKYLTDHLLQTKFPVEQVKV